MSRHADVPIRSCREPLVWEESCWFRRIVTHVAFGDSHDKRQYMSSNFAIGGGPPNDFDRKALRPYNEGHARQSHRQDAVRGPRESEPRCGGAPGVADAAPDSGGVRGAAAFPRAGETAGADAPGRPAQQRSILRAAGGGKDLPGDGDCPPDPSPRAVWPAG